MEMLLVVMVRMASGVSHTFAHFCWLFRFISVCVVKLNICNGIYTLNRHRPPNWSQSHVIVPLIFLKFKSIFSNLFDVTNVFVVRHLKHVYCIFSQNYLLCIISIVWYPMQYGKNAHRNNKSRWGRSQAMIGSSHPLYPPQEQMFVIFINIHLKRIFIFLRRIWF